MEDEGFVADAVATGEECLKALERRAYGCILLDVWLPGIDGLETLQQLRAAGSDAAVVIISGHGNVETAVRATKLGAFDFIEKPLSIEKTVLTVRNALRQRQLELINAEMSAELAKEYTMVGESVAMRALRKQISVVAPDRWSRFDLRRVRHRQRVGGARNSCPIATGRARLSLKSTRPRYRKS